jgi:hypothetical protein
MSALVLHSLDKGCFSIFLERHRLGRLCSAFKLYIKKSYTTLMINIGYDLRELEHHDDGKV